VRREDGEERNGECIKGRKRDRQKREREKRGARRSEKGKNEEGWRDGKEEEEEGGNAKIEEAPRLARGRLFSFAGSN